MKISLKIKYSRLYYNNEIKKSTYSMKLAHLLAFIVRRDNASVGTWTYLKIEGGEEVDF